MTDFVYDFILLPADLDLELRILYKTTLLRLRSIALQI